MDFESRINEINTELKRLVQYYEELNKTLFSLIGAREYQLHRKEQEIKLLEAEIERLSWQLPSDN